MSNADATPSKIEFHYIKSNYFRVIYAEGAYGGINPRGNITFSFYNERNAIPQVSEVSVKADEKGILKSTSDEKVIATRNGVVRELEVEISMNLETAISFHDWLGQRIEMLKGMRFE